MGKLAKEVDFQEFGDDRGHLVVMEGATSIPFEIKRIYYIYDTKKGISRGFHAHHKLKQVLVAVRGSCEMHLDNGTEKEVIVLKEPSKAIVIDTFIWREMHNFSENCVLLCLASGHYDEDDYIRCYDEFLQTVAEKNNKEDE
jgi:dTDP-4-dehydrorhamnose 3,5-epimerase-like enzyme